MGLIRKLAVRGYSKELKRMIDGFSKLSPEQIAPLLVTAVWGRATLNMEGHLTVFTNDDGKISPDLCAYPILLKEIEEWISIFDKNGDKVRVISYSIWVHTLRSIIRPELSDLANEMWDILMESKPYWEEILVEFRDEYLQRGKSPDDALKIETHTRDILDCLPPIQLTDER